MSSIIFIDLTNEPDDIFESNNAQNPIFIDDGSEDMKEIQRERPPQKISKAKKLRAHGEPLQSPPQKILRRSIGKRDSTVGIKKYDHSNGRKDNVYDGDEVLNSSRGGTSLKYSPRQVLKGDCVSKENSKVENKSFQGLKLGNRSGDWEEGYQQWWDKGIHHKVKDTLELFREELKKVQQENKHKTKIERYSCYTIASNVLKKNGKWLNINKRLGFVSGIEIGDEFLSKMELKIVGLHHRQSCGIDYLVQDGVKLATSIVATRRYANKMEGPNTLFYIGEGGNPQVQSNRPIKDQKLDRGNLALKNSIEHKTPVRVIRQKKSHHQNDAKLVYVYEGLYFVENYRRYRGKYGKLVFEFVLRKNLENTFTDNQGVFPVKQNLEPNIMKSPLSSTKHTSKSSCDCSDGCLKSENCLCMIKNDGKIPYDCDGCLVKKLPLIYECGPYCKCPLSCMNRVTQRGTRAKLELFKDKLSRYGVRSKSFILKGNFICKYVPRKEFLIEKEVNDFTMDVSEYAYVGKYIGNSNSPNLYGQGIIIDREDKSHLMLFAMRNISPWEELTIGYKNRILNT